jgi:hypothetical protein
MRRKHFDCWCNSYQAAGMDPNLFLKAFVPLNVINQTQKWKPQRGNGRGKQSFLSKITKNWSKYKKPIFSFLEALEFELRASHLWAKLSTTWAILFPFDKELKGELTHITLYRKMSIPTMNQFFFLAVQRFEPHIWQAGTLHHLSHSTSPFLSFFLSFLSLFLSQLSKLLLKLTLWYRNTFQMIKVQQGTSDRPKVI